MRDDASLLRLRHKTRHTQTQYDVTRANDYVLATTLFIYLLLGTGFNEVLNGFFGSGVGAGSGAGAG